MSRSEHDLRAALRLPEDTGSHGRLVALIHDLDDADALQPAPAPPRRARSGLRRRQVPVAACVAVVALAAAIGIAIGRSSAPGDAPVAGPAAASSTASSPSVRLYRTSTTELIGRGIDTGIPYGSGRLVLQAERDPANGMYSVDVASSWTAGSHSAYTYDIVGTTGSDPLHCNDRTDGFHCGRDISGVAGDRHQFLLVGYVLGPDVAAVSVEVDGDKYDAQTARAAAGSEMHLWWLDGPMLTAGQQPFDARIGTMWAYGVKGGVVAETYDAIARN